MRGPRGRQGEREKRLAACPPTFVHTTPTYFEIDKHEVWKVVEHDLAPLRIKVVEHLSRY